FRNVLIAAEVAMSLVLLMPAGLFLRSLSTVHSLDIGFRRDHLALVSIALDPDRYTPERGKLAYREIVERLRRIPGVERADLAGAVPLSGMSNARTFFRAGSEAGASAVECNAVGPDYFETLGIPLLGGRGFMGEREARPVAVVMGALARV